MGNSFLWPRRGDDRRQEILKEAQVARLYGEDTFRDIVRQSETMPLMVPMGFGCGAVRQGDWRPARNEYRPENRAKFSLGDYLSIALSLPFCGFSSLSALINEATVNGKRDANNWFLKNNITTVAGAAYWQWMATGFPAAGVIPTANVASTAPINTTAGAFGQGAAPGSNTKHLVSASAVSSVAIGALLVQDMTLLVQPILATTGGQTITGSPTRYQANGNNGVLPWFFQGTSANASSPGTLTLTYTESTAGTTGRTAVPGTGQVSATAQRTNFASGNIFCPIQSGDVGVRRIETAGWGVAMTTACAWGLAYPYCWIPVGVANGLFGTDLINTQFNLVQVIDAACISFVLMSAGGGAGVIQGELILVSGNS